MKNVLMSKKRIRLTESQLVSLIQRSLLSETEIPVIEDSLIQEKGKKIADIMSKDDVKDSDIVAIERILTEFIFGAKTRRGTCALETLEIFYTERADHYDDWTAGDTGDSNTLQGDLDEVSVNNKYLVTELLAAIKKNKDEFCKNLKNPPKPTPPPAPATDEWACAGNYVTYGKSPNQWGEVEWNGGKISFYLDKRKVTANAPANHNVLYTKGNRKWTGEGTCQEGGPGVAAGLVIPNWTELKQ